jgi:hypothetical protein
MKNELTLYAAEDVKVSWSESSVSESPSIVTHTRCAQKSTNISHVAHAHFNQRIRTSFEFSERESLLNRHAQALSAIIPLFIVILRMRVKAYTK